MTNNMAIGPAINVGGNEVQMTTKGKVRVTNPKGKVITLSQDQFQKQTLKNFDKIQNGEDFEYKKDRKGLKIAGAVVGTAAVVTGVIYRKEIARYMKNFSFKKAWNDFNGLFRKDKTKVKITPDTETNADRYKRLADKRRDSKAAFESMTDKTKPIKRKYLKPDGTVMTAEERKIADKLSKEIEANRTADKARKK